MRADHRPAGGVEPEGGARQAVRRRRPALCAAARGRRRSRPGDRRFLDAGARGRKGRRRRRGLFRRQPAAYAVPARPGAREPLSSLRPPLSRSDLHRRARRRGPAARRGARARRSPRSRRRSQPPPATKHVDYEAVWRVKRAALEAWSAAFARARAARPGDPLVADYHAFAPIGRRGLAALRRLPGDRRRGGRRELAAMAAGPARRRSRRRSTRRSSATAKASSSPFSANGSPTASSAGPPSGRARAASRSDSIAISRSAPRRTARNPGRTPARSRTASRSARRPIRFPPKGRTGTCRRRIRSPARARGGPRSSAVYRANMRHAGMLRIDHAMGLQRLFLIPDGAKPAEGAYLSYPFDDLIGHIALESQRAHCMVVGEDLGTVPEGFRERLTRANIQGMRVLVVRARRRKGAAAGGLSAALGRLRRDPRSARRSPAGGRRRHRRAALARSPDAWPGRRRDRGAARGEARPHRRPCRRGPHRLGAERRGAALRRDRRRRPRTDRPAPARSSPMPNSTISSARRSQTNLPGTDRERPNWRLKVGPDVAAAFAGHRAHAILAALAKGRT